MEKFDIIVIGGGPGGYVCAIKAAQLGFRVACIEGREKLGGTCLNVGCIPSKALLHASEAYHDSIQNFSKMGLDIEKPKINWPNMLSYKDSMIKQNTQGIEYLFKKNKVQHIKGWASIIATDQVKVNDQIIAASYIVIATGSEPTSINNVAVDQKSILDSTGALKINSIPKNLAIIGAGVIGLEMGSIFLRLGSKVSVFEYFDHIAAGMDREISKEYLKILKRQGMAFHLNTSVQNVSVENGIPTLSYKSNSEERISNFEADKVLVATGRKAYTSNLGLSNIEIETNELGQIEVNDSLQTRHPNIFAIGDVIAGPMLAHKAEDEGIAVAEKISGQAPHINYNIIPGVIYTSPEVAAVGSTEEQLSEDGQDYKIGKFSFVGNGRAKVNFASSGFVKIIADATSDRILGAHIIGPNAGDLIHEICVAMEFGASTEDLARTCHAHPTVSEAVREAALACGDGAIHS
ncbi:MAG: dihydrolipoyl dehydrogenase [Pseudomonadota bacterium]|nr:dihydrolipoyl dehydrogenase [Pseudomonadota bacterium]